MADGWQAKRMHRKLDPFARPFCPVFGDLGVAYHGSVEQGEYATDLVFRPRADGQAIDSNLTRTALHTVKPDHIATFLGQKLVPPLEGERGQRFHLRREGTRIKHTLGPVSLKRSDKFGLILRLETTVNDVCCFRHYREGEPRDGTHETQGAPRQKTISSLPALRELRWAAHRRSREFLSTLDDPGVGTDKLNRVCKTVHQNDRSYRGFHFFAEEDQRRLEALARGEFNSSRWQNKTLRPHLRDQSRGQLSRLLKRLRLPGLARQGGRTYQYYLTTFGKQVIAAGLSLKNLFLIPQLAACHG